MDQPTVEEFILMKWISLLLGLNDELLGLINKCVSHEHLLALIILIVLPPFVEAVMVNIKPKWIFFNIFVGACLNIPNECRFPECGPIGSNGRVCNDSNKCTINEKCSNGIKTKKFRWVLNVVGDCIGTKITCNDGVACTEDSCDPVKGCVYDTKNSRCEDKIECTINKCTAKGCVVEFDHNACDDKNKCTKGIDKAFISFLMCFRYLHVKGMYLFSNYL